MTASSGQELSVLWRSLMTTTDRCWRDTSGASVKSRWVVTCFFVWLCLSLCIMCQVVFVLCVCCYCWWWCLYQCGGWEFKKKKKDYIHTCLNRCNYDYYYHIFRFCFCVFLLAYSGLWNVYICIQSYISQYSFSTCSYYMSCSIFPLKYTLVCVFDDIKTHVYCTWDFVYCTWDFVYCVFSLLYTLIVSKNNICLTGLARVGYNGYHFTGYPESMPGQ